MVALATRMLGDADDAADAVQVAWMRVWQAGSRVERPEALLRTVVVRECLRQLRWRAVRRWIGWEDLMDVAEPRPDVAHQVVQAEQLARVAHVVAALPPRQRLVWGLRFDEGWTLPEIAAATGLSTETIRTHLERALARVRDVLGEK